MHGLFAPHVIAVVILVLFAVFTLVNLAIWIIRRGVAQGARSTAREVHRDRR